MALRMSQQREARLRQEPPTAQADVVQLPGVRAVLEANEEPLGTEPAPTAGDDDAEDELEADAPDEALRVVSDADYYADAFESLG